LEEAQASPISFPVPLSTADAASIQIGNQTNTADCPGTVNEPKAEPGWLCVYLGTHNEMENPQVKKPGAAFGASGVGTSGAILVQLGILESSAYAAGSFALTAPAAP
jgi:hypothetical protein